MKENNCYIVKFNTPPFGDGVDTYVFSSLKAIYSVFTKAQIGCQVNRLWATGVGHGFTYRSKTCTITKDIIRRMPQNSPKFKR